jgi:hypothetical protein
MMALNGTKASSFLKMSPRTTDHNRELSGKLKNAAYFAQHGAPKCRIAPPLGFVPKPCIRLVLKILWVGDELVKGCKRQRGLRGAGCSRTLAAMLERYLTGNSKRRGRPEQRRSAP